MKNKDYFKGFLMDSIHPNTTLSPPAFCSTLQADTRPSPPLAVRWLSTHSTLPSDKTCDSVFNVLVQYEWNKIGCCIRCLGYCFKLCSRGNDRKVCGRKEKNLNLTLERKPNSQHCSCANQGRILRVCKGVRCTSCETEHDVTFSRSCDQRKITKKL